MMRSGDGALPRLCSLRRFVRPMLRLFEIPLTHMRSVRSIEPPPPSTASMTRRIVPAAVGAAAPSRHLGARGGRVLIGTSGKAAPSRRVDTGAGGFKDAPP